jgi:hypothetical protein
VPHRVSRKARSFAFRVASLAPAELTIRATRAVIGRTSRKIRVKITPGRTALNLEFVFRSGRFVTAVQLRILR